METTISPGALGAASKGLIRRLLTIGENRAELLLVELQEERERLFEALLLALGVALFGFLTGLALTFALVVLFWHHSPVAVLLGLTGVYALIAAVLYSRLTAIRANWRTLPETLEQLRKDRACLEKTLK